MTAAASLRRAVAREEARGASDMDLAYRLKEMTRYPATGDTAIILDAVRRELRRRGLPWLIEGEPARPRRQGPGRPRVVADPVRIMADVPREVVESVDARCGRDGIPARSEGIRRALAAWAAGG